MSPLAAMLPMLAQTAPAAGSNDSYLIASIVLGLVALFILVIELFVPTGGLLAILCTVAFISSVVAMFMWSTSAGIFLLFGYMIAAPFALLLFLKLWERSPIVRRFALRDPERMKVITGTESEAIDPDDPDALQAATDDARRHRLRDLAGLVGQRGVAETPLRPIGFVRIGDRRLDASAETGLIDPGTPVRVVAVIDGTLKVRAEA